MSFPLNHPQACFFFALVVGTYDSSLHKWMWYMNTFAAVKYPSSHPLLLYPCRRSGGAHKRSRDLAAVPRVRLLGASPLRGHQRLRSPAGGTPGDVFVQQGWQRRRRGAGGVQPRSARGVGVAAALLALLPGVPRVLEKCKYSYIVGVMKVLRDAM